MAGEAVQCEVCRFGMAARTSDPDTAHTIQIHTVAKCTGVLNIPGLVMEGVIRAGPILWMCQIGTMTGFTTVATNAYIETRIAAGTAGLSVAGLTECQVLSSIGTMQTGIDIGPINRMWNCNSRAEIFQIHC